MVLDALWWPSSLLSSHIARGCACKASHFGPLLSPTQLHTLVLLELAAPVQISMQPSQAPMVSSPTLCKSADDVEEGMYISVRSELLQRKSDLFGSCPSKNQEHGVFPYVDGLFVCCRQDQSKPGLHYLFPDGLICEQTRTSVLDVCTTFPIGTLPGASGGDVALAQWTRLPADRHVTADRVTRSL